LTARGSQRLARGAFLIRIPACWATAENGASRPDISKRFLQDSFFGILSIELSNTLPAPESLQAFNRVVSEPSRPAFLRGDCAWGTERAMEGTEQRNIPCLFKLKQTANVKKLIDRVRARFRAASMKTGGFTNSSRKSKETICNDNAPILSNSTG
jgi:hypothetical protein